MIIDIGKAHQREIREKLEREQEPGNIFGKPPSVVDIKDAKLKEISRKKAESIILRYEWLGTMGTTQMHYGIFFKGHLAGAICFGFFQAMNRSKTVTHPYDRVVGVKFADKGIQLTRGACAYWAHPHSGSKLISYGLRQMKAKGYKYCVAFSDPEAGEIGTLYQATNWYFLGATKHIHFDVYYKRTGLLYMNERDFFRKHGFCGKVRLKEFLQERPEFEIRERRAKGRYIYLLGTKKENKIMYERLKDKIKPYPKRREAL